MILHLLNRLFITNIITRFYLWSGLQIRIRIRCFCMDPNPDPVFKFLWIRIRIQPLGDKTEPDTSVLKIEYVFHFLTVLSLIPIRILIQRNLKTESKSMQKHRIRIRIRNPVCGA